MANLPSWYVEYVKKICAQHKQPPPPDDFFVFLEKLKNPRPNGGAAVKGEAHG